MAGNPYLISEGSETSGNTTAILLPVVATSAGDVIHVSANCSSGSVTATSVTDSKGNTYALINSDTAEVNTYEFETTNSPTSALNTTGDSIIVHFSGTGGAKSVIAIGLPGYTSGHDVAPTPVHSAAATSSSIASGTLSQANEVLIAVLTAGAQVTAPTWGAGWTQVGQTRQASNPWLTVAYQIVSSTSSVNATASWPSSVKYCTLLTSYKVPGAPPPTGLYLVGSASAASGGSSALAIPITNPTNQGDTITVGALADAGSVTGVTDSAGNTYTLSQSETTNAGCQLYTFESSNSDPVSAAAGSPGSLVGCTVTTGLYATGTTRKLAADAFDAVIGNGFNLGYAAQKVYYQAGNFPQAFKDGVGQDITPLVNAGCQIWLCYQPTHNGSDLTALTNSVQWWLNNHPNGANGIRVIIYQEPQNSQFGFGTGSTGGANYIACVRAYAPTIRGLTDPGGNNAKIVYDAAGHAPSEWVSWYPGNANIDEITVDYYGNVWAKQTNNGTTNLDPLGPIRNLALSNNKPFGVAEMGLGIVPATTTQANFNKYMTYVTNMMAAIPVSLRTACMWYAGDRNDPGENTPQPGSFEIGPIQNLWNALTATAAGGITVQYSGTASNQAAIAIGDQNVASGDDKAVGATATTGTTASVATGTLAQAEEHIIAFVGDLAAGGSPTLGDGLTTAIGVRAGTGPFLKAGYKAVNSTSSDTPSATITSTTWTISVVTHALNAPVIQGGPGTATVGQAFSFTASASGGTGALTWSSSGTLPPGLSFSAAGVESGTPTIAGTYNWTLIVTDSLGLQGTLSVTQIVVAQSGGGGGGGTTSSGSGNTSTNPFGPAPATILPTNILSLADSDSESTSAGYTWAALTNASAPAQSTSDSVTGIFSTAWTAVLAGTTQITTGLYAVAAGLPYICSCFILAGQTLPANVSINWFDNAQNQIAVTQTPPVFGTVPNGWTPLSFATVAPGNAAFASLVVTVQNASIGQAFNMDLAFLTQSSYQILIDWNNPTFTPGSAAGQNFMDVSPFVRLDLGFSYTRGRQDSVNQVQPGSASIPLQNDLGTFARLSTTSIPASIGGTVTIQRRCQINLADELGQFWTRFDGSIAQIDYTYDTTGNTSIATVTLTDVLSSLNRQNPLFCWTKSQVLADGPMYHWSLNDPGNTGGTGPAGAGGFGTAAETSGSNGPPMRLANTDSSKTATITWQSTLGGVETLADAVKANAPDGSEFWTAGLNQPSSALRGLDSTTVGPFTTPLSNVYLHPVTTAQSAQNQFIGNNGFYLQAELPQPLATNVSHQNYSFECWFTMDPFIGQNVSANYGPYIVLSLGSSRQKATIVAGVFLNGSAMKFEAGNWSQPPAFLGLNWPGLPPPAALASTSTAMPVDTVQRPHHLVLNVLSSPAGGTCYVHLDGVNIGNFALVKGQVIDTVCAGAAYGGAGAHFGGVQLVSVYPFELSPQLVILHAQLGQYGMWETPSDDALAQVASYAVIPAFWTNLSAQHNGLSLMEYMDITGSNALTAMQLIAQAENGLLFVDATGALNFHTRDWRMGYGPPDLLLPPESFSAQLGDELVDQFMANEMGVASPITTGATAQQGTTISPVTGQTLQPTNTVSSANVQAGFINTASQAQYGVYATNPVGAPVSLPLISFSRAYAQLGIVSLTSWPDPNLLDLAAWNSNSRSDPYLFPAQLTIDLLTIDPNDGIGISSFYALDIDNMIAPTGPLPQSFPNEAGSLEWFIEGVTETVLINQRTLQYYVSPAATQRAWIPGDPVYGILGSTARLGISQSDLSVPQADGKDVSHDAGPPYWPTTFSSSMNNPDGNGNAFVGASDMRGIVASLQLALQPPMCIVSATQQTQSFGTGALSNPSLQWDNIHVDTEGGMGLIPGWPNWYVCTRAGFWDISASLVWSITATQASFAGIGWIAVARAAAQALAAGAATPLTVAQYVCPVGEVTRWNSLSMTPVSNATTRIYLGLGDMVALCGEHNFSSSHGTSTATVGSHMSLRFAGYGTADDRANINSSLSAGGTVTNPTSSLPTTATFQNLHTYTYQGETGSIPFQRRNTDLICFQGIKGGIGEGSQTAQVSFNSAQMISVLSGRTIKSATLTCTNLSSWYPTGTKLMLGYTSVTPGGANYQPSQSTSTLNIFHQKFPTAQQLTFAIPISMVQAFVTGGATALVLGDSETVNLEYVGQWKGGPNAWTITVTYK